MTRFGTVPVTAAIRGLLVFLTVGLLIVPGTVAAAGQRMGNTAVAADPDSPPLTYFGPARQLITVVADSSSATTATLTAWERTDSGWRTAFGPMRALVGAAGIGQASEGSTKTPAGVWSFGQAFGRQPNPGTRMSYFKTDVYDWWNGNSRSPAYNTHVRQAADPGNSENLYNIGAVYDYAIDMGYNTARTPGAGSAFFLHVTDGRPTGGCVAIDRAALVSILQWLDPAKSPAIDIGTVPAPNREPTGTVDSASASGDAATVSGWAFDPDRLHRPIDVHVYDFRPDGSAGAVAVSANQARPDVANAFPGLNWEHGFTATLQLAGPGRHNVCAFAINVESGSTNSVIGCRLLDVPPPIGAFDQAAGGSPGVISTLGWAADPIAPGEAVQVRVTVSGPAGTADVVAATGTQRDDVGNAFSWAGNNQGFVTDVPTRGEGVNKVCAFANAVRYSTASAPIGCRTVIIENPFGTLDSVTGSAGSFTIGGWVLNPNNPGERVEVHVYDDGPSGTRGTPGVIANQSRPDVANAFAGYDNDHGFSATIPAEPGQHRVCTYAITTGGGTGNPQIGCRDVTVG